MDRTGITKRFIKLFHLFEDKGIIARNDRERGLSVLAQNIFGNRQYGHRINKILRGDLNLPLAAAYRFCEVYGVNESYLIKGQGSPFGKRETGAAATRGQIYYVGEQAAVAGDSVGGQAPAQPESAYFSLPGLSGNGYVAFRVEGNSMEPKIHSGDILICREVEGWDEINDNEIYTVVINDRVFVKYIKKIYETDDSGREIVTKINLISANYLEHAPFTEDVTPNTKVYKVIKRLQDLD